MNVRERIEVDMSVNVCVNDVRKYIRRSCREETLVARKRYRDLLSRQRKTSHSAAFESRLLSAACLDSSSTRTSERESERAFARWSRRDEARQRRDRTYLFGEANLLAQFALASDDVDQRVLEQAGEDEDEARGHPHIDGFDVGHARQLRSNT